MSALKAKQQAHAEGDRSAEAKITLELSWLVKWVRSDNHQDPFSRSLTLALEAVEHFRAAGDRRGEALGLIAAVAVFDPNGTRARLEQAEVIARDLDDRRLLARVLAARSRHLGMSDRTEAPKIAKEALALFQELGDKAGMAGCHFSLAIQQGTHEEKREHAVQAFYLFREFGDKVEAGRALMMSLWNVDTDEEKAALEPHFLIALEDAKDGTPTRLRQALQNLSQIAAAKGDLNAAESYLRESNLIPNDNKATPEEDYESQLYFTKMLLKVAQKNGDDEAVKVWKQSLKQLKKTKVTRDLG